MNELEPGDPAPDFCLPDNHRGQTCLADLRGKWVVLYFYPKDNTPGCTMEAVYFSRSLPEFRDRGAEILGISADSVDSHCAFAEKHELAITLLSDGDRVTIRAYGAWKEKKLYGKSSLGIVRSTFMIDPEGRIAHVWPRVRVKGHMEQVLKRLDELRET